MIRSVIQKLQIVSIDVFVYVLDKTTYQEITMPEYPIEIKQISRKKTIYKLSDKGLVIHRSTLFTEVFLLRLIHKKGPVIGDCYTHTNYRGLSLYPKMIHYIAKTCLFEKELDELFIIVDTNNIASIRGIEKAGFVKHVQITTKRWLWLYFNRAITYMQTN